MTKKNPAGGLLDLIERHRNGRPYTELAAASHGLLKAPAIRNLVHDGLKSFPKASSLEGYSYALGVPLADVVLAAAVSLDLDPRKLGLGDRNDLVIPGAGSLPEDSRQMLRDMASMMLWWQAKAEGVEESPAESAPTPEGDPSDEWQVDHDLAAYEQGKTAEEKGRDHLDGLGEESQVAPDEDD